MKQHNWVLEEQCFGPVGCEDCWVCKDCGADGGMSNYKADDKPGKPTYGYSTFKSGPLELPEDCELSKIMIDAFDLGTQFGEYKESSKTLYENVHRPFRERLNYLLFRSFK